MRGNLARPLSLADLARTSGWAASHFSAVFRKQTNTAPLVFLTRLKLHGACELLKSGESTVAQVAAAVGYDNAFYFSRLFAREIGLPPHRLPQDLCAQPPGMKTRIPRPATAALRRIMDRLSHLARCGQRDHPALAAHRAIEMIYHSVVFDQVWLVGVPGISRSAGGFASRCFPLLPERRNPPFTSGRFPAKPPTN